MSEFGQLDIFDCVSPLDFRYWLQDDKLRPRLEPFVTERARVRSEARVEAAAARVLAEMGVCSAAAADEIERAAEEVTPEEVAAEEARIKHNIRALVNSLRARVSPEARPFVHLCLTSFDVIDTATAWRMKNVATAAVLPQLRELVASLIVLAQREKDTVQIGRTHGQHAEPITFGFAVAEYVARLGNRCLAVERAAAALPGKLSGAVGAYNASSLFFPDAREFERRVLDKLGLPVAGYSTQVVEPEPLTDFVHALVSAFGVLANLGDDMRALQRTEIAEVGEVFEANQVGSSTMPHKRNPWNFENVKSMWKAFMPRMITVYSDQISEHQRDLTNSASQRFIPELVVALVGATQRMERIMGRLVVDREHMERNFNLTAGLIAAEPAYLLLAAAGHPDAHEAVRCLTLEVEKSRRPFVEVLREATELQGYFANLTPAQWELLADPRAYTGLAARRTEEICAEWTEKLGLG
ncbi:MAG TPA: lyase family protein [Armatimonadota bacterium]|jgi:adenylosuccinate lyase